MAIDLIYIFSYFILFYLNNINRPAVCLDVFYSEGTRGLWERFFVPCPHSTYLRRQCPLCTRRLSTLAPYQGQPTSM